MKVLGLCGQSGAGKTTVLNTLLSLGATVCDCDKISRQVMSKGSKCAAEVIQAFGNEICRNGEIDRKTLGSIVFFDEKKLALLTEITHRYIKTEVYRLINESEERGDKLFVLDAPLLFESGLDSECDITLAITADREKRIERIIKRDNISRELAEKRIESQISEEELHRLADEVISNNKTVDELEKAIIIFAERRGLTK